MNVHVTPAAHSIPQIQGSRRDQPVRQHGADHRRRDHGEGRQRLLHPGPGRRRRPDHLGRHVRVHGAHHRLPRSGDLVRVTGTVTEYTPTGATRSYTEIKNVTAVDRSWAAATPSRRPISRCRTPTWAATKACWCASATPLTVQRQLATWATAASWCWRNGRHETADQPLRAAQRRKPSPWPPPTRNNLIVLDDGIFVAPDPDPLPGRRQHRARGRHRHRPDRRDRLRRHRRRRRRAYKLQPTEAPVFSRTNRAPATRRRRRGQRPRGQRQRAELLHHLHRRHRRLGPHRPGLHAGQHASRPATAAAPTTWRNSSASATRSSTN